MRPGPIQGDMVHPYLRRREGKEKVSYPKPEFEKVLGRTLGVPLFQEQAMRVAIECVGFSPAEADKLRRSMATFKFTGGVSAFAEKLVTGMVANGYEREFAERTFKQLEGFGSYGFPESHAASFALIAYASSWMKCHHPEVFCAALLNAQPMGFYAPAQIVRDAREHGVVIRPPGINHSRWDCTLEATATGRFAVRLGLRMAKGLANDDAALLVLARGEEAYRSVDDLWRRAGIGVGALERLANADAYGSLGLNRRDALWAIRALEDTPLPLLAFADHKAQADPNFAEPAVTLEAMPLGQEVVEDYGSTGLSLRPHPVSFMRSELYARKVQPCVQLLTGRDRAWVTVAGLVLVRQKPGSAKGVMFITLEDETGIANLVIWPSLFDKERRTILSASMLEVRGRLQREGDVVHLVAHYLTDMTPLLRQIGQRDEVFPLPHGRGDEARKGSGGDARDQKALGRPARDIYIPDLHIHSRCR